MKATRRAVMIGAATTSLASIGALAGTEADPVIGAAQRWHDRQRDYDAAEARDAADAEIEAVLDRQHEVLEEILATPARSLAGIRAKIRIAAIYITTANGSDLLNQEDRLTLSALADAERLIDG